IPFTRNFPGASTLEVSDTVRVRSTTRFLLAAGFSLLAALSARAQSERILDYHSEITLEDDASLQVTETITVISAGSKIRHGIFRDFPTTYTDPYNNRYVVGFQMISAARDSAPEQFRLEEQVNGKRIYLGNPNALVSPGRHAYTLTYTTNRQLGYYKDHDELFWNVTGNGWDFPIDSASATVHLPGNIPAARVTLSGFTGPQGSREAQLSWSTEDAAFELPATASASCSCGPKATSLLPPFRRIWNFSFATIAAPYFSPRAFS